MTLAAQQPTAPAYVLYRLFFRDVDAMEAASKGADAAGRKDGNEIRAWYQGTLALTSAEAAGLKRSAASCNAALEEHHTKALPVVLAVRAKHMQPAKNSPPSPELVALEKERTAISNSCIDSLKAILGNSTFDKVDTFVQTAFARKVTATLPPGSPIQPPPPSGAGK